MKLQPVALDERVEAIDLMRGVALFGILLVNMLAFHTPYSYIDPHTWFEGTMNSTVYSYIDIFIQASFYPLFAMLFGYGLAMQFMRTEAQGRPFIPLATKRLAVLLGFGVIHAFFIWYGDILITYAIMGFLLIGLLRFPAKWLLSLGSILYVVPHLLLLVLMFIAVSLNPNFYTGIQEVQNSFAAYPAGSYSEIFSQRLSDWYYQNNPANFFVMIFTILPLMMAGAAAAKWHLIERTKQYRKLWIWLAVLPLSLGLLLKATPYLFEKNYAFTYLQDFFGGPLVAVGYAALIALVAQKELALKLLSPVVKVGRMSLTTYITQSILATSIFYSYGLGLYGQVNLLTGTWIAIGIFILQLIFAELWFTKYSQGPLEKLWRKLTY
ncbi:MAG TPA: DUF418 domain-containing protein [Planococcus sp. (in: firmicutes)]|nr:DUF418 domain-containing protein [Planococcus sp. (in: firmicutes)]